MSPARTSPGELIGTAEAARIIGCTRRHATRLAASGRLPAELVGDRLIVRRADAVRLARDRAAARIPHPT